MKVLGYVRVSTEEQAEMGVSLAAQAEKVRAYCKLYDLDLVRVVEDAGVSAKTIDRPGLQEVLASLGAEVRGVVIAKLDRLTRSVVDLGILIERYFGEKPGYSLFSVADSIDTRTAAGRMVLNILTSVSQWEREVIGERTRDALRHKASVGEVYGPAPLGYAAIDGRLVEERHEQETVALIRQLREQGLSLRKICARLEKDGRRPKGGGEWWASTVKAVLDGREVDGSDAKAKGGA